MASTSLNYPLLAVPAYYVFSLLPHVYSNILLQSSGYKVNNANPKASITPSAVQGKVPDAVFQKYQRAENAQANNLEQMPLFAVAILASIIAERSSFKGAGSTITGHDPTGLRTFLPAFFAVRTAYTLAYIHISDHAKGFIRSALWMIGVGLSCTQVYKAAQILG